MEQEQEQKQGRFAQDPLPAQAAAAVILASPEGSTAEAMAQYPGTRLVPLMVPTTLQAYRAQ